MILRVKAAVFAEKPVPVSKAAFRCERTAPNRLRHVIALATVIEIPFV